MMGEEAKLRVCSVLFCVFAFTPLMVSKVEAYTVSGELLLAADQPSTWIQRFQDEGTENVDADYLEGTWGNSAQGMYLVSLDQGVLASYLGIDNGQLPFGATYHAAAQGATDLDIVERLDFMVPAGTYPDGITAYLGVTVRGRVEPVGGSNAPFASAYVYVNIWGEEIYSQNHGPIYSDEAAIIVAESFDMEMVVAYPGTVFPSPWVVSFTMSSALDLSAGTGAGTESGHSISAFMIRFDHINISEPGVTWSSDSGVFAVPEPSVGLLLMAGLPALGGLAGVRSRPSRARACRAPRWSRST